MDRIIPENLTQCALDFDALNDQPVPHNIPKNIVQISATRKKCSKCGGIFSATKEFFSTDKQKRDGLTLYCKECQRVLRRKKMDLHKIREPLPGETKQCSKCKETFPATTKFFGAYSQNLDGLSQSCRMCCKAARVLPENWEPPILSSQTCSKCKKTLPSSEFHKDRRRGLRPYCKKCQTEHNNNYRINGGFTRKWYLNRVYGITEEGYEQMLQMQGGVCALCKLPETAYDSRAGKVLPLAVDHDHVTGAVRALLCKSCNQALGMAKESPELLRRMADYIEEHNSRNNSDTQ